MIKAIVGGAIIWVAVNLVAIAYQPGHVGSVVATIEIGSSLVLIILGCLLLRPR